MKNSYHVEHKNFVEDIFKETYGKDTYSLNINEKLRDEVFSAVCKLRGLHRAPDLMSNSRTCENFPYHDADCRNAYMFAYYPYHVAPAYEVAAEVLVPHMQCKETLKLECFAGGPCPEVLGTARALRENNLCRKLIVNAYDFESGWLDQQKITVNLCKKENIVFKKFNSCQGYDIRKATVATNYADVSMYTDTDIFLVQNYLSHSDGDENFFRWVSMLAAKAKPGAFFVFIDFKYARKTFEKMTTYNFLTTNNFVLRDACVVGDPIKISFGYIPVALYYNAFGEKERPKSALEYYFVVLQKQGTTGRVFFRR